MTLVILFVFGTLIGSFLNVLALRLNTGLSLGGRSSCPACRHSLAWYELIPIVSFLFLKGRCRACRAKISYQYPLVEFLTGLIFVSIFATHGLTLYAALLTVVFSLYLVIVVYDLRHKIIPDSLVYLCLLLSLTTYYLLPTSTLDLLAGPILFAFFASIWFVTQGKALGFGDSKLVASFGFLLGAAQAFSAIVLAFWIGAVFGLLLMLVTRVYPLLSGGKGLTMKSELPFAPFLVLGAWLSLIFNLDLLYVAYF